jgi:ribonuclease HI
MDIPQHDSTHTLIYADDVTIACRAQTMQAAKLNMTNYLRIISDYFKSWGLVVNPNKTVFQYFSNKCKQVPVMRFDGRLINYKAQHKVLGMILDAPRLCWGPHITSLRCDIIRRMDLLKHMASPNWGASRCFLRKFYCAYIRAKMDYGSTLYQTASNSMLAKLDVLQNACLRLILGARRTTPIISLQAEARIPALFLRRQSLGAQLALNLCYRPTNDETASLMMLPCTRINSTLATAAAHLRLYGPCHRIPVPVVDPAPPWEQVTAYIQVNMNSTLGVEPMNQFSATMGENFPGFHTVFCDGSRLPNLESSACGIYIPSQDKAISWRLHPKSSVLTAELFAIYHSLVVVEGASHPDWVVCSDSRSALLLLQSPRSLHTRCSLVVYRIREMLRRLNADRRVMLQWVKAHAGIRGNELADRAAKLGHELNHSSFHPVEFADRKYWLSRQLLARWQENWHQTVAVSGKGQHLLTIREDLLPVPWIHARSRRVTVVLARLRLGHVGVNEYMHRFSMSDSPLCATCNRNETIEHFMLQCSRYSVGRRKLERTLFGLGIQTLTLRTLLGGGDYSKHIQHLIIKAVTEFLASTGRLGTL